MKQASELVNKAGAALGRMREKLRDAAILQRATVRSVKKLDKNIYLLDYRNDYHLPELLEKGVSSIGELMAFAADSLTFGVRVCKIGGDEGAGCSTFEAFTPAGDHILARNFDYKPAPCFLVWTHPENGYASVSSVDANFMLYGSFPGCRRFNSRRVLIAPYCCVDGMNEKGLAIAVLQMRAKATKQTDPGKKDITTTALIRAVLDTCANVDEAVALLKKYNMHDSLWINYHYQIVDASGRSVVAEYIGNTLHICERGSDAYPVTGSVFEDDGLPCQYAANFSVTKELGSYRIEQHGEDRAEAIKKVLKEKDGTMTELEAMDLLSHVRLLYKHDIYPWTVGALWSAVYNTQQKTVKIAANLDYGHIYTFKVDAPRRVLKHEALGESAYPVTIWSH